MPKKVSNTKDLNRRDPESGRFISGNIGGGRPIGSRNKLTTEFVDDLLIEWRRSGPGVLKRLAADDPAAFARLVAQVLPREIDATLNVNVELAEAKTFDEHYQIALKALEYIGAELDDADEPELIENTTGTD